MKKISRKTGFFDMVNLTFFVVLSVITVYPFINAVAYSFSDGMAAYLNNVTVYPAKFTLSNYEAIFNDPNMTRAFSISILRTTMGIIIHLMVTGMASYALSKRYVIGRKYWILFFLIPIYINGGLIPYFVIVRSLHLINNFLVYVLPTAFSSYELLIMKTYFESLPPDIEESAVLDGAGMMTVLIKIIIPISAPIIATIVLFHGVFQWNSWFDAMLFVTNTRMHPLQMILQRILFEEMASAMTKATAARTTNVTPETIKMTALVVSMLPILCVYPLLQRYYVKGIMIGAIKA